MKKILLSVATLAIAVSCTVSEIDSVQGMTAPEIVASFEDGTTKTTITTDADGVGTIWWTPADEINVFYDKTSTHYVSKNTENATTVAFGTTDIIGSTESGTENLWGLYPYDKDAVCDGSSITTTIPASQKAVPGEFDDDLFTSLAHSTSTTMTFYNVLGGIKFSLSRDDIQTITFKGNNNEDIVGKVKLEMNSDGRPEATVVEGEKTITITPKEGTTFAKNTNYYIVMLPTVLSNGFTMTFETADKIGTFEYTTKSVEIKRSVFGKKENIDSFATFIEKGPVIAIPDAVDLGLSVKWASFNIGATLPEEYGDYYAWGETETKSNYSYSTYIWCNGSYTNFTKYNTDSSFGTVDNRIVLEQEDDAAYENLGDSWHIPSFAEYEELVDNCEIEWGQINGVNGVVFTSRINGASIFLPAAGYINGKKVSSLDKFGSYLTSSINATAPYANHIFSFGSVNANFESNNSERINGCSVRPVYTESHQHSFEAISGKTPTEIEPGWKDYYRCSVCGLYWGDNEGMEYIGGETALALWKAEGGSGYLHQTQSPTGAVDMGLSVYWANCNLGASSPEEYGDYYAWGETETKSNYSYSTYIWCNGSYDTLIKYNHSYGYGTVDCRTILELADDAAHAKLGGSWRMPKDTECQELIDNCEIEWTQNNEVNGLLFTSKKNGNSIFFPAAGCLWSSDINVGTSCFYWSSTLYGHNTNAYSLCFNKNVANAPYYTRCYGLPIRPVSK